MTTLQAFSDSLADAVATAAQSVALVDARHRFPASGIVWSADGEILTADHVVQRDEHLKVKLADGKTYSATLIGRDPSTDLALLKAEGASGLTPPTVAEVRVGHLVYAVGRPDDAQAALGNVVALGGPIRGGGRRLDAYIQVDLTMYPGFSGGALVDASGRVAGLVTSALARGVTVAVPIAIARRVADSLRQFGRIKRGFLGVSTQPVKLAEGLAAQLNQATGLMLIGVEKDSPAEKGGLLQGDVLVGAAGDVVADLDDLHAALGPETIGQATPIKIVRGGEVKTINVVVGERE